ncbi:MAG: prolipoprotein diacylglyceryl transferase [Simkaniaceae bacterium]|nr:prolipoprotein diacylglyceryl transferase [Simkaniaceae bacterium]
MFNPDSTAFFIPFVGHPVAWYGILFSTACFVGFFLLRLSLIRFFRLIDPSLCTRASFLAEKMTVYAVIGLIAGARIVHLLFYEHPVYYLRDPFTLFRVWEGGLAGHGGVVGLFVVLFLFLRKYGGEIPSLSFLRLTDLLVCSAMAVGFFVRIGNFINQEVVGRATRLPWAVCFGSPAGALPAVPRHPTQLYEAAFFACACLLFIRLLPGKVTEAGGLTGICMCITFIFRFAVEFLKEEQSALLRGDLFTMGHYLSIPFILVGTCLVVIGRVRSGEISRSG